MSREVLSPPLQRIGANRCYRVNLVHDDFGGNPAARQRQPSSTGNYTEQDLYADDDVDDEEDEEEQDCLIEELPNSMFKLSMHVATAFYGGLVGFKGSTKRRIESETQTDINVPRSKDTGGGKSELVTIKGKTRSSVCNARRKIKLLVVSLRKRMRPTHFLCVPLNSGEIKQNFIEFKKQLLEANLPGIGEQIFQAPTHIHLTLNTVVLLDDEERAQAVKILESCREFLADLRTPFDIKVSGLEIMNDDPSAVRVLYACVESPELQQFGDRVMQRFVQSTLGFNEFERDGVKLHMTLLNSRYGKRENEKAAANNFDAREILKRFGDFNFGTSQCSEIQLCVLGSASREGQEFYKTTGTLKF